MDRDGEARGRKILPLGQGECDLAILRIVRDSGYRGPDRHPRPHSGRRRGPAPRQPRRPRLACPPTRRQVAGPSPEAADACPRRREGLRPESRRVPGRRPTHRRRPLIRRRHAWRRAVRLDPLRLPLVPQGRRPGRHGRARPLDRRRLLSPRAPGRVTPLAEAGGFRGLRGDGRRDEGRPGPPGLQARRDREGADSPRGRVGRVVKVPRSDIESTRDLGTLMPEGLADAMTPVERRDLVRFLMDLGRPGGARVTAMAHSPRARSPSSAARSNPALAELATPHQPRPRLRLLRERGGVLREAAGPPLPPTAISRPRRRCVRPLGQPEREGLGRRPLERRGTRLSPLRHLPPSRRYGAQGRLRPPGRARGHFHLLQSTDALV